jgi:hypothetical protein
LIVKIFISTPTLLVPSHHALVRSLFYALADQISRQCLFVCSQLGSSGPTGRNTHWAFSRCKRFFLLLNVGWLILRRLEFLARLLEISFSYFLRASAVRDRDLARANPDQILICGAQALSVLFDSASDDIGSSHIRTISQVRRWAMCGLA